MDASALVSAMPGLSSARAQLFVAGANQAMLMSGITNVNRAAMFLAQVGHESVSLTYTEEIASGAAYEGREDLGNTQPGDGVRFKGRSFIQITGRHNYGAFSQWAFSQGLVGTANYFVSNPSALASNEFAWMGPVWYWTVARSNLNALSDARDIQGATKAINGGLRGLADRTSRWQHCLGLGNIILPSPDESQSGGEVTMRVIVGSTDPRIWVTDGITKRYILGPAHLDGLLAAAGQSSAQLIDQSSVDAIPEWAPPGQIDTAALTGAVQDALSGDLADQIVDTLAARLAQAG